MKYILYIYLLTILPICSGMDTITTIPTYSKNPIKITFLTRNYFLIKEPHCRTIIHRTTRKVECIHLIRRSARIAERDSQAQKKSQPIKIKELQPLTYIKETLSSPNQRFTAVVDWKNGCRIFNQEHTCLYNIDDNRNKLIVASMAFHPNGTLALLDLNTFTVQYHNLETKTLICTTNLPFENLGIDYEKQRNISFRGTIIENPGLEYVVQSINSSDKKLKLNSELQKYIERLHAYSPDNFFKNLGLEYIKRLDFSPDGTEIAILGKERFFIAPVPHIVIKTVT